MIYVVQPGDSLFVIAQRFNVSIEALLADNPQITDPNLIFPGQIIGIPLPGPTPPSVPGITYIIQQGDTLFSIGLSFGVSVDDLMAANPQIEDPNAIFPGQVITIPTGPTPPPIPPPSFTYVVQPGDTLFVIAGLFGVSLNALIAANPEIADPNFIFPGQFIRIPTDDLLPPPPSGGSVYIAQPGDTLFFIAQRFGVSLNELIEANPQVSDPNLIFPGLIIIIPPV